VRSPTFSRGNSLKNGLLAVVAPKDVHSWMFASPESEVEVDLATQKSWALLVGAPSVSARGRGPVTSKRTCYLLSCLSLDLPNC
jgi:hypothetical protein